MVVSHKSKLQSNVFQGAEVRNAAMKVLVSPQEGWEGHVMRMIELGKDGFSPRHTHDWPHINYVVKGKGKVHIDGVDYRIEEGSYAYVPSNALHQFINTGDDALEFICIVPEEGHK
ncbi:MAG: cupin domain-containing protein [Clostridia bacterium]|nr:cupin domain-containing protein [Clostridia bacterium]